MDELASGAAAVAKPWWAPSGVGRGRARAAKARRAITLAAAAGIWVDAARAGLRARHRRSAEAEDGPARRILLVLMLVVVGMAWMSQEAAWIDWIECVSEVSTHGVGAVACLASQSRVVS